MQVWGGGGGEGGGYIEILKILNFLKFRPPLGFSPKSGQSETSPQIIFSK